MAIFAILGGSVLLGIILIQLIYYAGVILDKPELPSKVDLVVVYGGGPDDRITEGIRIAERLEAQFLLISDDSQRVEDAMAKWGKPIGAKVIIEQHAKTTDQNARYTAPIISRLPIRTAVLVTSWFHMPRALFLCRLYFWNSNVRILPFLSGDRPELWWKDIYFLSEIKKFWGSIGRIGLNLIGF